MKREEALKMGIQPDKMQAFLAAYWKDVHKLVERSTNAVVTRQYDTEQKFCEAINSMIQLIHDRNRLHNILVFASEQYAATVEELGGRKNDVEDSDQL